LIHFYKRYYNLSEDQQSLSPLSCPLITDVW